MYVIILVPPVHPLLGSGEVQRANSCKRAFSTTLAVLTLHKHVHAHALACSRGSLAAILPYNWSKETLEKQISWKRSCTSFTMLWEARFYTPPHPPPFTTPDDTLHSVDGVFEIFLSEGA